MENDRSLQFMGDLNMEMRYCMHCGHKLDEKYLMGEGMVPYCPNCEEFRFPVYNTAVSMIVMNKELDRVLLIKQYGRDSYILVAGYVNKGEDAEDAVSECVLAAWQGIGNLRSGKAFGFRFVCSVLIDSS